MIHEFVCCNLLWWWQFTVQLIAHLVIDSNNMLLTHGTCPKWLATIVSYPKIQKIFQLKLTAGNRHHYVWWKMLKAREITSKNLKTKNANGMLQQIGERFLFLFFVVCFKCQWIRWREQNQIKPNRIWISYNYLCVNQTVECCANGFCLCCVVRKFHSDAMKSVVKYSRYPVKKWASTRKWSSQF